MVRHVRLERPEVIVTMWPGPGTHGQHQMASRAATLAFERAGDPAFCPDQVTRELLSPFEPSKLYYYPNDRESPGLLAIPTNEHSRSAGMRYADLKSLATWNYRSQGYDRLVRFPAENASPEQFLLVRSRVPREEKESGFFAGTHQRAGDSPLGVTLSVEPARFEVGAGIEFDVKVRYAASGVRLDRPRVSVKAPEGWSVSPPAASPEAGVALSFRVQPGPGASLDDPARLEAEYRAESDGREVRGRNHAFVRVMAPVRASFRPLFDIAGYREFARATGTEWVIPRLPARVPLVVGRPSRVMVAVTNDTAAAARVDVRLEAPAGIRQEGASSFACPPQGRTEAAIEVRAEAAALPEGRRSARLASTLVSRGGEVESRDRADLYLLPALSIPRLTTPPVVDGDLTDLVAHARGSIGPKDLWTRREPSGPDDLSAEFFMGWDAQALYVGVRVHDEAVVCNIPADDVRAQLRSDSVGITVDPSGQSRDTSTTFQAAAFPCTTEGFAARGFRDADADQGLFEDKAPGARVASRRTEGGYDIEFALPWATMPAQPRPGAEIAVNVVLYDGDQKDARPGANINESGLAWAAFDLGGKQALPYLWPRVTLAR